MSDMADATPKGRDGETQRSEAMKEADVANGERPEESAAPGRSSDEPGRATKHPVGEEQAAINRDEDPPA